MSQLKIVQNNILTCSRHRTLNKDLENWNPNFWRVRCREQVIYLTNCKYFAIIGIWNGLFSSKLSLKMQKPSLRSPRILNQRPLYFKQFQWQFNGATGNVSKASLWWICIWRAWYEIFYIVGPNNIFWIYFDLFFI